MWQKILNGLWKKIGKRSESADKSIRLVGDMMLFYLVGIKGAGMSALAKILHRDGHLIYGVDVSENFYTNTGMQEMVIEDFSNMKLKSSYFYIIGNAYEQHSVTRYIRNMHFRFLLYPEFLNFYFRSKRWICISGSHGKTTTTKLTAHLLNQGIALIGNGEIQYQKGNLFVLESCEYKNTFLKYHPQIAVVLNVDYDHPDFFKSEREYRNSFLKLIQQSRISIINGDELPLSQEGVITFGRKPENDICFTYEVAGQESRVRILNQYFVIPMLGVHFAYDFVGAYLVCKLLGISDVVIRNRLNSFQMPNRRLENVSSQDQEIYCDYAHHPSEIKAFYETICLKHPNHKKIIIFEPHTISRLETFQTQFKEALSLFDECYMTSLFTSCREVHQTTKEQKIYQYLGFPSYSEEVMKKLMEQKSVVICFLGAGTNDRNYQKYLTKKRKNKSIETFS